MAETIVQVTHGNLFIKTGSAQDALLLLAAAENYLLKAEDHLQIAEMEIDSMSMMGAAEGFGENRPQFIVVQNTEQETEEEEGE